MACDDAFLIQHIHEPTRLRQGQQPSLVDLLFTNRDDMVTSTELLPGLGKSDHSVIICNLACSPLHRREQERYNYRKADFDKLLMCLSQVDWSVTLDGLTVDETWLRIKTHIVEAVDQCVPKRRSKVKRKPLAGRGHTEQGSL